MRRRMGVPSVGDRTGCRRCRRARQSGFTDTRPQTTWWATPVTSAGNGVVTTEHDRQTPRRDKVTSFSRAASERRSHPKASHVARSTDTQVHQWVHAQGETRARAVLGQVVSGAYRLGTKTDSPTDARCHRRRARQSARLPRCPRSGSCGVTRRYGPRNVTSGPYMLPRRHQGPYSWSRPLSPQIASTARLTCRGESVVKGSQ